LHAKSFLDDPTRIVRAARFKARLGFRMEAQTFKILKSAIKIKVLDTIKPQRYLKEFTKVLKETKAQEVIQYLKSWGVYNQGVSVGADLVSARGGQRPSMTGGHKVRPYEL
jgi:tRNA nucleotidyltransferase/poly(A) polymerase